MRSARYYLSWSLRKLWALMAIMLVTLAVLLSALRLTLPHLDSKKQWLEDYISDTYGAELTIGSISASWSGTGPAMVLRDIQLNSSRDAPVRLRIDETEVELDFWASVLNANIQSKRFHLNDLELMINLDQLEGDDGQDYPVVEALQSLFLEQLQRFSVTDSRLLVTHRGKQQTVDLQKLSWLNQGQRHQGVGLLRVSDLTRNSASFILDLNGDSDNLSGTFYANASDLDISPWLTQWNPSADNLTDARVNMTLWTDIEPQGITETQAVLGTSVLTWEGGRRVEVTGGRLDALPDSDGWRFSLSELMLDGDTLDAPLKIAMQGHWSHSGQLRLQASELGIKSVTDTVRLFRPRMPALSVRGQIQALQIAAEGSDVLVRASANSVSLPPGEDFPGLGPLSVKLDWHNQSGHVSVQSRAGTVLGEQFMGLDLDYQELTARGYIQLNSGVEVYVPKLSLSSELLTLEQSVHYRSKDGHLSLATRINDMDIAVAKELFPGELMGQGTRRYLTETLKQGQVSQAGVIWQGAVDQFPFEQQQGVFQAGITVDQAVFEFAPDWPALTDLNAEVLFENQSMRVTGRQGRIGAIKATRLNGTIPDLTENASLMLDLATRASGQDVTELMNNSGLKDSVGATLRELDLTGPLQADVAITIPLSGQEVVAEGRVRLDDNGLHINSLNQSLKKLSGELTFTNDAVQADGLTAQLWQQPLQLSFQGQQRAGGYQTEIELAGQWRVKELVEPSSQVFSERFDGVSDWTGTISLTLPEEGYQYQGQFEADLSDLSARLPAPYAKKAGQAGVLTATVKGDALVSDISVRLNDDVTFNGLLPHKEMRFSRAHLAMGQTDFVGMGTGFSISANLPRVNLLAWQQSVSDLLEQADDADNYDLLSKPERIFLYADRLELAGLILEDADVNVKYTDLAWLADVSAKQSRAEVRLFHDWQQDGVEIEADYLTIPGLSSRSWQDSLDSEQFELPPVRFRCGSCQYREWDLGQIDLSASPTQSGMAIDSLLIKRPESELTAKGQWFNSGGLSRTRIEGRLTSDDIGRLLNDLDVDSGIRDSGADIRFDVNWQQAPYQFNVASLDGNIDWRLSDGYLAEVSDKGARLFSILSLDSLVRKLTLDFRDVFAKGFFYDEMEGSFQLKDGRVNTEDTVIDGAAGKMQLAGYTDLNTEQLSYDIEFTPKITSSLPVILAWMANPATAIAAFAIDEVLTSAKVISNIKYSLTGTLEDPILKEVGRDSREVELPANNKAPDPVQPQIESNKGDTDNG